MSGTDIAYAVLSSYACATRCQYRATRCPVLTSRMVLPGRRASRTEQRGPCGGGTVLSTPYRISGTVIQYGGRGQRDIQY
eukprot:3379083-Rhodomonas_salina.2